MSINQIKNVSFQVKEELNNGLLKTTNAMPQKDSTSDGQSTFSIDRKAYEKSFTTRPAMTINKPAYAGIGGMFNRSRRNATVFDGTSSVNQKRFFRNTDASEVTRKNRVFSVGGGTLNANNTAMSFESHANVNTVNSALNRVRAGGAVAPLKKNFNKSNAYTPARSYAPWVIPQRIIGGVKMPPVKQDFGF
jgi:hypothetical protein